MKARVGEGRKANDRRRVRANRVVETAHTGKSNAGNTMGRQSRVTEFKTGFSSGKNGRA